MRFRVLAPILAVAVAATPIAAAISGAAMPDITRQYHERKNCHQAYAVLVEDLEAGRQVDSADAAWAKAYEDAGAAGEPCPRPAEALLARAGNLTIASEDALAGINAYREADPAAKFELAYSVLTGKFTKVGPEVGWGLLGEAARSGDPSAQYFLALMHMGGALGTANDYASGYPLVEQAANAGHIDAIFQLANMKAAGLGTKKDMKGAFELYGKAAERGHVFATYQAAVMANEGDGVKEDHELGYRLARNLVDQGEVVGAVLAASALLQQRDNEDNEDEVLYWMDLAMREGDESIRSEMAKYRPQVQAAYRRLEAPPEYTPRERKICPKKTVCYVNQFTGVQSCTTNTDYWNDCDTGLGG